jgi:hypothetical protein
MLIAFSGADFLGKHIGAAMGWRHQLIHPNQVCKGLY